MKYMDPFLTTFALIYWTEMWYMWLKTQDSRSVPASLQTFGEKNEGKSYSFLFGI